MWVMLRDGPSCRWDLVKRVPKEVLDYLAERAKASAVDDIAVRSQYVACQDWLRCSFELVKTMYLHSFPI